MKKTILILALISLPAVWSLLKPGFFPSHDGEWMVIRLSAFHQALKDGQFPVRWSARLNHGYGYPVLNFLYPLPFYFGEIFYLVSGSFSQAVKLVFILSFFASALTMFIWLRQKHNFIASLAGSVLYVYTPYRFVDTYVRGSLGEALGFVFVPLMFLGIDLLPKNRKFAVLLGALAFALTILSHNVFIIFVFLAILYGLITLPKKYWLKLALMVIIGACLSAYFWWPALSELKYVYASTLSAAQPAENLLTFKELIIPSWGYGLSHSTGSVSMSFQLGVINLAVVVLALWTIIRRKKITFQALFFPGVFVLSIFLMHKSSALLWNLLPEINIIQFPWRLLAITTFISAAVATSWLKLIPNKWLAVMIILGAMILTKNYVRPSQYNFLPDVFYSTNDDTTTARSEYMPLWVKEFPREYTSSRVEFISGRGVIYDLNENNRNTGFRAEASEDATVKLATIYYPGWHVTVNGQVTTIDYSQNGMMAINIAKGINQVNFQWQETPQREMVNYLSLITLLAIISHVFCTTYWKTTDKRP